MVCWLTSQEEQEHSSSCTSHISHHFYQHIRVSHKTKTVVTSMFHMLCLLLTENQTITFKRDYYMHLTSQPLTLYLNSVRSFDEVLMPNTGGALCLCWGQQRNCCGVPHSSSSSQPRQPSHGLHTTGAMQPFTSRKISDRLMETGIKEGVSSAIQMLHLYQTKLIF